MIKKLAWNVFKSTGNVNTFLELKQIENIENLQKQQVNNENKLQSDNLKDTITNFSKGENKWE